MNPSTEREQVYCRTVYVKLIKYNHNKIFPRFKYNRAILFSRAAWKYLSKIKT